MIASTSLPAALRKKSTKPKPGLIEDRIQYLVSIITGVPTNSLERFSINFLELHIGFSSLEDCEQILLEQTSKLYHDYEIEKEKKRKTQVGKQKRLKQLTDLQIELRETEKHFRYYLDTKEELRHERQIRRRKKNEIEESSEEKEKEIKEERDVNLKKIQESKKKTETEISFLKTSHEKLVENHRKVEEKLEKIRREIEEVKFQRKQLTDHVQLNQNEPKRIAMQAEVVQNFIENVETQRRKVKNDTERLKEAIQVQGDEKNGFTTQINKTENEMGKQNNTIIVYSKEIHKLEKQISDLLTKGNDIESTIYKRKQEIKALKTTYYVEMKKQKKKKKMLSDQKEEVNRVDLQIENTQSGIKRLEERRQQLLEKRTKLTEDYNATKERIDSGKFEIDLKINSLIRKDESNRSLILGVKRKRNELKLFEDQLVEYMNQEKGQRSVIFKLKQERERYTRALSNEKQKFVLLTGDMKMHHFVLKELKKEHSTLHKRRKNTIKMYQMVKMERNKSAKMIQDFAQTLGHITRNKTILENEHEILQRKSLEKEKDIKKYERKVNHLISIREESKRKQSKLSKELEELDRQKDEKNNEVRKLQKCIEEDGTRLSQLKKQFEMKVEERNYNGIQLMDRNDELCILHEKLDFQKGVLKKGEFEISKKEEQIRLYTIQLKSMLRELIIHNERLPDIQSLIQEKEKLKKELQTQFHTNERLSDYIQDYAANTNRFREIKAKIHTGGSRFEDEIEDLPEEESETQFHTNERLSDYIQDYAANTNRFREIKAKIHTGGSRFEDEIEDLPEEESETESSSKKKKNKKKRRKKRRKKRKKVKELSSLMDEGYPKIEEIKEKIDEFQKKIYRRKERHLEKQLILKELTNTTDKMRKLCMESRDYYLDLSMNLNKFKRSTDKKNRELKSLMSELSIHQAKKMELSIQNKQLKKNIVKFEKRLENDLPPTKEMFKLWEREELVKERREKYFDNYIKKRDFENKNAQFATITRTKATKRPNAYVPDAEGVMALPKPYMMKPFVPRASKLGGIRHIKKPINKNVVV